MIRTLLVLISLAIAALQARAANEAVAPRPLLLELFTSESCSSCPPADAYVASLQGRSDVLPLSLHVDYWDDLGWRDHYSSAQYTRRQQDYAGRLHAQVYTPQLVVDGVAESVGSDRSHVETLIGEVRRQMVTIPATLSRRDNGVHIEVGAGLSSIPVHGARLLLISFDPMETDAIHGGENRGRTIAYHNVVRSMRDVGAWTGAAISRDESLQKGESGAKLVLALQDSQNGSIVGVAPAP